MYSVSKKSWSILHSRLLYKTGQDVRLLYFSISMDMGGYSASVLVRSILLFFATSPIYYDSSSMSKPVDHYHVTWTKTSIQSFSNFQL